jgi:iron(III) transport system permease protein
MKSKRFYLNGWTVISLVVLVYFIFFFIYPITRILISSVWNSSTRSLDFSKFIEFFSNKFYTNTILNSLKVCIVVTILTSIFGSLLAYITRTISIKLKNIVNILLMISVVSPPFLGAYAWIILLGRAGIITKVINSLFGITYGGIYGFKGIVLVFTIKLIPLIYLYVSGALKNIDNSLLEASESLGCNKFKRIIQIVVPLILPTILASSILVFMRVLADFGTPMLIGEGYRTLPVLIYNSFISDLNTDEPLAATISVVVILITTVIFLTQRWISNRKRIEMSALHPLEPKKAKGITNILAHAYVYIITALAILPIIIVFINSFMKSKGIVFAGEFTFNNYIQSFKTMGDSIINTLVYSLLAIAIVIVIGVVIAYTSVRRKSRLTSILDLISMFPYIIPGAVLGIALLLAFNKKPLALSGTFIIIVMAYVIRRLPYTIRSSAAILKQIDLSVEEASMSLGANRFKTFFSVTTPMMFSGVMSGAIMSWLSIITELSASILLYSYATKTLTISIYLKIQIGDYGQASALSSILMLTSIVTLLLFFKLSGRREIDL